MKPQTRFSVALMALMITGIAPAFGQVTTPSVTVQPTTATPVSTATNVPTATGTPTTTPSNGQGKHHAHKHSKHISKQ